MPSLEDDTLSSSYTLENSRKPNDFQARYIALYRLDRSKVTCPEDSKAVFRWSQPIRTGSPYSLKETKSSDVGKTWKTLIKNPDARGLNFSTK